MMYKETQNIFIFPKEIWWKSLLIFHMNNAKIKMQTNKEVKFYAFLYFCT